MTCDDCHNFFFVFFHQGIFFSPSLEFQESKILIFKYTSHCGRGGIVVTAHFSCVEGL